jgi:hypothetical protein
MSHLEPGKEYTLTLEERPDYLYAYVTGEKDSYEISKRYWQEIADYLVGTDYKSVLVDEDITQPASVVDVFQLVSECPEMGFTGIRIAFFDRKIEHHELNSFGELVAANRGLDGRAFNDFDMAHEWIIKGD